MAHKLLTDIEVQGEGLFNGTLTLGTASTFSKLVFNTSGFDIGEIEVGSYQAMKVDAQDGVFELMSDSSSQNHAITGTMGGYVTLNHSGDKKLQTASTGINITGLLYVSSDARVVGAFRDTGNSPGTSGQVLSSTVTGTSWITPASGNVSGTGTTNNMTKWSNTTGGLANALMTDNGSTVTLSTNGSANAFNLFHTSGSGAALNIEKGGNNEGLIVNKTSGSGNAVSVTGDSYFNGDVGIGTDSPGYKLQVNDGNVAITGGTTSTLFMNITTNQLYGDVNGVVILKANNNLRLNTNGGERIRINSSGQVGIGTTIPYGTLDVAGSIRLQSANQIYFGSTGSIPYWTVGVDNTTNNNFEIGGVDYYSGDRDILLNPVNNGNVGIGTTSPDYTLDVGGELNVSGGDGYIIEGNPWAYWNSDLLTLGDWDGVGYATRIMGDNGGEVMRVTDTGVGIGETDPDTPLHIKSAGNPKIKLETTQSLYATPGTIEAWNGSTNTLHGYLTWATNPGVTGARLAFQNGGNTSWLEVGSTYVRNTIGGNTKSHINATGLGINNTNPQEALDVTGTIKGDEYKGYLPAFQHGGFYHSSSGSSSTIYWIPTNYISETTSSQYYNNWVAPYDGRVKKIVMRYASGTTPTATSVTFRKSINGGGDLNTYPATIVNGATTNMTATKAFGDTDITFNAGDRVQLGFTTNGGTRLLYGFAYTIVLEYDKD